MYNRNCKRTWTPYCIVSGYAMIAEPNSLNPFVTLIPSLFAKTSFLWFPIFYIVTDKQIRFKISKRIYDFTATLNETMTRNPHFNIQRSINNLNSKKINKKENNKGNNIEDTVKLDENKMRTKNKVNKNNELNMIKMNNDIKNITYNGEITAIEINKIENVINRNNDLTMKNKNNRNIVAKSV